VNPVRGTTNPDASSSITESPGRKRLQENVGQQRVSQRVMVAEVIGRPGIREAPAKEVGPEAIHLGLGEVRPPADILCQRLPARQDGVARRPLTVEEFGAAHQDCAAPLLVEDLVMSLGARHAGDRETIAGSYLRIGGVAENLAAPTGRENRCIGNDLDRVAGAGHARQRRQDHGTRGNVVWHVP